jgi:hypothetical protein
VLILASQGGGGPAVASAAGPFGPHYAGLDARREAAHVPTMMQTMNSRVHFHPLLAVYVDGKRITVPADIGIDPKRDSMQMAGLHTHDASGTIHVEGVEHATLGQFFRIWGVALSSTRLGPYRAGGGDAVRLWLAKARGPATDRHQVPKEHVKWRPPCSASPPSLVRSGWDS